MVKPTPKKQKLLEKSDTQPTTPANINKVEKKLKKKNGKRPQNSHSLPNKDTQLLAAAAVATNEADVSSSDSEPEPQKIQKLLEPYSKDQLIEFIIDAAVKDESLLNRIHEAADKDVSHRKIFVHGLSWDTTRQTLASEFEQYGEIEDCNVVTDRNTGKAKGYGFILFKSRRGAMNALKQPRKKIGNRIASCQLATVGPVSQPQGQHTIGRKIYVSNVQSDVDADKLRFFFSKFGEIETGPIGFDMRTGKSRGFALFVYKTQEGAKKALEEPYKMFEGHQLHCQRATEGKSSTKLGGGAASVTTALQPVQAPPPPMLATVAAAQNLAFLGQNPGLNQLYNGLMLNPNALVAAGGFGQGVVGAAGQMGQVGAGVATAGLAGYGGLTSQGLGLGSLGGSSLVLRGYGGTSAPAQLGLQQVYPNSKVGQTSSAAVPQGTGASFSAYPSYT